MQAHLSYDNKIALIPEIPAVDDWIDFIYFIFRISKITFSIRLQQDRLEKLLIYFLILRSLDP